MNILSIYGLIIREKLAYDFFFFLDNILNSNSPISVQEALEAFGTEL